MTETCDLAAERPEVVAELASAWEDAAWTNRVFPLDDHGPASDLRRPSDDHFGDAVTLRPGTPTLERWRSAQLINHRDLVIVIGLRVAAGDQGVLLAHGDQGGGYLLVVETDERGEPSARFVLNAYGAMITTPPITLGLGDQELQVQIDVAPEFRWRILLTDGTAVGQLDDVPQLLGMAAFTGISVGADCGGPVDWSLHERHGAFPWSGVLHHVRYVPGRPSADGPSERARVWAEGALIYD